MPVVEPFKVQVEFNPDQYRKLCALARRENTSVPKLLETRAAVWLGTKSEEDLEVAKDPVVREGRIVRTLRSHLLTLGPQTMRQLEVLGFSRTSLLHALDYLLAAGQVVREEGAPEGMGRPPFLYVPVPSKINAAIALRAAVEQIGK